MNITGSNRGLFNLDDINAAGKNFQNGFIDYPTAPDGHPYKGGSGAEIADFNVTTAFRSEVDENFEVDGQPEEVGNDIDDLEAGFVRNMDLNIAEFGSLSFGEIATNIGELDIQGAGDLFMFGAQGNDNKFAYPWFIEDIQATNHDGDLMLDFRDFLGRDDDFGSSDFEGTTRIQLGDQSTTGPGIRFDSYYAPIVVTAGSGDMIGSNGLPEEVEDGIDDGSAKPIVGGVFDSASGDFEKAYFGLVLGKKGDTADTGAGSDYVHGNRGNDDLNVGADADVVEPGRGIDVADLGSTPDDEDGDGAADLHIIGEDVLGPLGEKPEDSFDLVRNFEEGTGNDVTRLVKAGFVNEQAPTTLTSSSDYTVRDADMPQISNNDQIVNASDVDIFEILPDFITVNLDAAIQNLNPNGEDTVEENFFSEIEGNSPAGALSDYLADPGNGEGVFVLAYDEDGPNVNAGLFFVNDNGQESIEQQNGEFPVNFGREDVQLVSVYEDVGGGEMEADDFQLVGVEQNNGSDALAA